MKNLKNNSGVTLLELVVAVAILALLGTAIVGIMASNTSIFRKNKADMGVQTSAEETYNRLKEDLMQAKYVYIEGYATSDDIKFDRMNVGKDLSSEGYTLTPIKLIKTSDDYLIDLAGSSAETYTSQFCIPTGSSDTRADKAESVSHALSTSDKSKFDVLFNKSLRYMDDNELVRYGRFIDYVIAHDNDSITTFTHFDSDSVCNKSGAVNTYSNIYVTKIIIEYTTPMPSKLNLSGTEIIDTKYMSDSDVVEDKPFLADSSVTKPDYKRYDNDYCICEYTFDKNTISYTSQYGANDKKNTTGASDTVYSKTLNYAKVSTTDYLSAVYLNIDGSNDCIGLNMYFDDKNRTYIADGMTYLRNSYVLHDAK